LTQWEGSVTQYGGMTTSAGGEAALSRGKGGNDASWDDTNLVGPKIKKIHAVHLAGTNER
jgi:hypothetical protein